MPAQHHLQCVAVKGCCERHPEACASLHHAAPVPKAEASNLMAAQLRGNRAATRKPAHGSRWPADGAQHGTFECCGDNSPPPLNETFWHAPVPSAAPYDALVGRLLEPFGGRIPWAVVRASAYDRDTCAVLRVAGGTVCKVARAKQRTADFRAFQEAGLYSLVRELASMPGGLPDLEMAYCMGDGSKVVHDYVAARRRWGGASGCEPATVFTSASFQQFRCQAQSQLPFFFWYREPIFGKWREWDATTAALRTSAEAYPWAEKRPIAFFRGSLNEGQTEAHCLGGAPRSSRCELYHLARAQPTLIDYRMGDGRNFSDWAAYKCTPPLAEGTPVTLPLSLTPASLMWQVRALRRGHRGVGRPVEAARAAQRGRARARPLVQRALLLDDEAVGALRAGGHAVRAPGLGGGVAARE